MCKLKESGKYYMKLITCEPFNLKLKYVSDLIIYIAAIRYKLNIMYLNHLFGFKLFSLKILNVDSGCLSSQT